MRLYLTRANIDAHAKPAGPGDPPQRTFWDTKVPGLGLKVGKRARTFVFQRDVEGRSRMVSLGRLDEGDPPFTPAAARTLALKVAAHADQGLDEALRIARGEPDAQEVEEAREPGLERWQTVTLREAMEVHVSAMRKKRRVERSIVDFQADIERYLGDWLDRPLVSIEPEECDARHTTISERNGPVVANKAMKNLRAAWRSTRKMHRQLPEHPVGGVTMNKVNRRREPIAWSALPAYWAQVEALGNPVRRDLRHFMLLTGLRSTDAKTLRWEEVNLTDEPIEHSPGVTIPPGCVYRPRPKGGEDRAFTAPLSSFVLEMLARRRLENRMGFGDDEGWAFPTHDEDGRVTHVRETKEVRDMRGPDGKYLRSPNGTIRKESIMPSAHRLRDTFATACREAGVPRMETKALMNHRLPEGDVTEGYQWLSEEHLRKYVDRVTAFLLDKAGIRVGERVSA